MCRHLGYLGPAVSAASLVLHPPHSLLRQSWAPADMRGGGTINADGFGVGWFAGDGATVYRRASPMWTDSALPGLLGPLRATGVLAAVRSATVGMPVVETAAAPFTDGRWLFSHNGVVRGWPSSVESLAAGLPVADLMTLDAPTDAALLWALVRARLRDGQGPCDAVADTVCAVAELAPDSRLNLMLTDGRTLVATAWTHSLSTLVTEDSAVIASEPWDTDPRWTPVPDRHIVTATATPGPPSLAVQPLGARPKGSHD
ncbi:ergothioneine biosynthesis protein EgtC [Kibdelosporangium phytohabitans]|uniref:Gamma-glutamyl-hercynylcysteine sulfoxide hydrolase n=1 Tax=Kibdelosporangium phytohabitans TaxID=860235 RepID=A0A0N9HPI3_9PSEU|nr:ergothioneine biosynthesis protein EgtC [Kibdelosporangium phytohabitans]ALG08897.1 glutamine amidotransferase class-II [Kibdelosporangium phytohabitans]MBE1469949.1 glutamine amidotransferase [Kibdelosporangium phytohabitans]